MSREKTSDDIRVDEQHATRIAPPSFFKVRMHNDDYTTMEFVVSVLEAVFYKTSAEANRIMLNIHTQGSGVCGTFPHEIAETKAARVHKLARRSGYPLRCSLEEV